jgi:hypothetical protein
MRVRLLLFARAKELVGTGETELELPDGAGLRREGKGDVDDGFFLKEEEEKKKKTHPLHLH